MFTKRIVQLIVLLSMLAVTVIQPASTAQAFVNLNIQYPFAPGTGDWRIISGYNNGHRHGAMLGDSDFYYAMFGFDFARVDGKTGGLKVLNPANAMYYRKQNSSAKCIDLAIAEWSATHDLFIELCHIRFESYLAADGVKSSGGLPKGAVLGTVETNGCSGNCTTPHIHMAAHISPKNNPWVEGGWARFPIAFDVYANYTLALSGNEYPDIGGSNQYRDPAVLDQPIYSGGALYPPFPSVGSSDVGGDDLPSWLEVFSKAEDPPLAVEIHTEVDGAIGVYDQHRVKVDGNVLFQTSAGEYYHTWDTSALTDGFHTLRVEYLQLSHNGNWNSALSYEEEFYLSANRAGYASCSSNVDGVELTSGSDCIIVARDIEDLGPAGWSNRANTQACVSGNLVAWLYDGSVDQYGNFPGAANVVDNTTCKNVGSLISSVNLRDLADPVPALPNGPFSVDVSTAHLWHFEDSHVDYIANGDTVFDPVGSSVGTVDNGQWVGGKFGTYGLGFFEPPTGKAAIFSQFDYCPLTVEAWVHVLSGNGNGDGVIAAQLGGNNNYGENKWSLSLDQKRPKLEIWSANGSLSTSSFRVIDDTDWHLVSFNYDCTTKHASLYFDNELVGELTSAAVWNSGATQFEVGGAEGIGRCKCEVDEVRISNAVREPDNGFGSGMIENGGFETLASGWATNWTRSNSTLVTVDTNGSGNEGSESLHLAPSGSNVHAFSASFNVVNDYQYLWQAYVRTTSGSGEAGFYIDEYDANDNWTSGQWLHGVSGSHNAEVALYYTPSGPNVKSASLQFYESAGTTFHTYIDSVSFELVGREELVSNGSFEDLTSGWADDWTRNNTTVVTIDTASNGDQGTNSLKLSPHANAHHAFGPEMPVEQGVNYLWTSYVKAGNGDGEAGFYVDEYDSNHNWISGQWLAAVDEDNDGSVMLTYTPSSGVAYASLQYYMVANTTFTVYIDSVSVVRE